MSDEITADAEPADATLTPRQKEVAIMLSLGRTNREIADRIEVSIKTVDTHRGAVLERLQLRNNVELARHALRVGWVTLDPPAT